MLTFTSTEPGFMGSAGSEPFVIPKPEAIKVVGSWRGLYLHGKAEDFVGYDIPTIVKGTMEYKPEQECLVVNRAS